MEQELNVTYRGIESNPSDYACVDGGLSECIGLDVRNGEIVNAVDPLLLGEEKGRLLGYHDIGDSRNKIVVVDGEDQAKHLHIYDSSGEILGDWLLEEDVEVSMSIMGNIVRIYGNNNDMFIYYDREKLTYQNVDIYELRDGIEFEFIQEEAYYRAIPYDIEYSTGDNFFLLNGHVTSQEIVAAYNTLSDDIAKDKYFDIYNRFQWVIAAIELYDGSIYCTTAPYLNVGDICYFNSTNMRLRNESSGKQFQMERYAGLPYIKVAESILRTFGSETDEDYQVVIEKKNLLQYKDIVKSINVYSTLSETFEDMSLTERVFYRIRSESGSESDWGGVQFSAKKNTKNLNEFLENPEDFFLLKKFPIEDFFGDSNSYDDLGGDNRIYHIKYPVKTSFETRNDNLASQEKLGIVPHNFHSFSCKRIKQYNMRDIIIPSQKKSKDKFFGERYTSTFGSGGFGAGRSDCYVVLNKEIYDARYEMGIMINPSISSIYSKDPFNENGLHLKCNLKYNNTLGCYLYNRLYYSVKKISASAMRRFYEPIRYISDVLPENLDDAKNAYYSMKFKNGESISIDSSKQYPKLPEYITEPTEKNYINVSEYGNPFIVLQSNEISVGEGEVMAIASMTKALSEGQFGQFPLVCFCTDGVYALDIANDGTIASVKPMNRQKILHRDAYVECDDFVCFVSQEGVMMMDGSQIINISEAINGRKTHLGLDDNLHLGKLIEVLGEDYSFLGDVIDSHDTFLSYMEKAKLAYDGVNRRILFYRSDSVYCYCYSLNTKYWTAIVSDVPFRNSINDYPDTLLQGIDNKLYRLNEERKYTSSRHCQGFMITRPLSFGDKNILKSIRRIIHRGTWDNKRRRGIKEIDRSESYVRTAIWGSRDLVHWVRLRSLRGTSMKYYRVAFFTNLKNDEAITASSYVVDARWANKVR
jgi:hypothetical protein